MDLSKEEQEALAREAAERQKKLERRQRREELIRKGAMPWHRGFRNHR